MTNKTKYWQGVAAAVTSNHMRLIQIATLCFLAATSAVAESDRARQCLPVGGSILTNLAVVDANTTLGTVTGDLRGAVAATILGIASGPNGTTVFTVQHHFVTEAGDIIDSDKAEATAVMVAPNLFAIVSYPIHIVGGTGRFKGATGDIKNIGEVDLTAGHTVFRYHGQVCFAPPEK